jgi:ferredoxin
VHGTKDAPALTSARRLHPQKDEAEFEQSPMLFTTPDECIDCGACVPACPVTAIYDSDDAGGGRISSRPLVMFRA